MNEQPHSHDEAHEHEHGHGVVETPVDAGSQALTEALRSSFAIVKVVMVILVVVFLCSGFFEVGPNQVAIILRFGKPVGEGQKALLGPGLHWSFPYPIDEYVKVSFSSIQSVKSTTCWYATTAAQEAAGTEPPPQPYLNPAVDGYAVTGDANIVHIRATLYYRVEQPLLYVFGFVNASNVIQNTLDEALLATAAHYKVDYLLYRDRAGFQEAVRKSVADRLAEENVGVSVDNLVVDDSIPPRQVKAAFDSVIKAELAKNKMLDDAHSYENKVLSSANADAESQINLAQADKVQLVHDIASASTNFSALLPRYEANPRLLVQQRLSETLGNALTNTEKWVLRPSDGKNSEVRLLLNREPEKPLAKLPGQ